MTKAPWTAAQVDNLNRWQRFGVFHGFTCGGAEHEGDRTLVATRDGWICCHCSYKQDWAHDAMLAFDRDQAVKIIDAAPFGDLMRMSERTPPLTEGYGHNRPLPITERPASGEE